MKDELIFLGTGGGRHHIRTQHRATGGILYKFNNSQAHIDPGPGALVRINQYNEDPTKTNLFISTHFHIDHFNDMSAIIEASRESFYDKKRRFVKKGILITTEEVLKFISDYHKGMVEKIIPFKPGDQISYDGADITATKVLHSDIDGFGLIFRQKDYSIGFSSDTNVFEGFSQAFNGVDLFVLNLLRPNLVRCNRHLCTDDVIPYLNEITPTPKVLIITHFGAYMDSPLSPKNFVPSQVEKLKSQTTIEKIIPAEDGLKLDIYELLKL
ncbi:MAG: Ribonuclease BN [Promethearchaeota archaeon]|nr:MAG: Ribonuclease BN [Candidatus Lokiarchaeota archaeon]